MKNKKGDFNQINQYLLGFIGFVVIILMAIFVISSIKTTSLVCGSDPDGRITRIASDQSCESCPMGYNYFNSSKDQTCCLTGSACMGAANQSAVVGYNGSAYKATGYLQSASLLPPQFASLIIITVIIAGILSLLALLGYGVYKKMNE
jgi:hypothetical protein